MKMNKKKIASAWHDVIHDSFITQQVFRENEVKANLQISKTMLAAAGIMLILWLLNSVGVLEVSSVYVLPVFLVGTVTLAAPAAVCLALHGRKNWLKYLLLGSLTAVLAYLDILLTFNAPLFLIMPVVFSCRYYSCSITVKTSVFTTVLFTLSAFSGAYFNFNEQDLNFASPELGEYIKNIMTLSFLPKWMTFLIFSAFCYEIARCGRKMVLEQNEISQEATRVNTELEMAGRIQNQALPTVASLPQNSFRSFDLAARMTPAKEVGGDFYDFFYPDSTHLAMIIADVADKGIAASLYMMMSKTLLESRISMTLSPGAVLEFVNRKLFSETANGMFVTVWLGILNLKTGELVSANAGHEYPVICRKGGEFELIKDKHGFVLGGLKSTKYRENSVMLGDGDTLFVYTDGVPEANNKEGQMFGTDRMLESLNRRRDRSMEELISGLQEDIELFADGAPQFDDTTMLAFRLDPDSVSRGITVKPLLEMAETVQEYVSDTIAETELVPLQRQKLGIAVDEIFSNIVKYSRAKQVNVLCEANQNSIRMTFSDDGIPFDSLSHAKELVPDPKKAGGLGILIIEKVMDSVEYRYSDGKNILTVTSIIKENGNEH